MIALGVFLGRGRERHDNVEETSIAPTPAPATSAPSAVAATPPVMVATSQPDAASRSVITNSIKMKLVLIQPGKFIMGDASLPDAPPHEVTISTPFYMGMYEVSQAELRAVFGGVVRREDYPAARINWAEATRYCHDLSVLPAEQGAGRVYRLPTEAEWEYACRAGTTTRYAFGDSLTPSLANFGKNPVSGGQLFFMQPVGSYPPNAWGLYDMHGNLWQWCSDYYAPGYDTSHPAVDPTGPPTGTTHVARGGCWNSPAAQCASAYRFDRAMDLISKSQVGFRVVCIMLK